MERKLQKFVFLTLSALCLTACTEVKEGGSRLTDEATERFQRGVLQADPDGLTFTACESDFRAPVDAPSSELSAIYRRLSAGLRSAIYVEFNGNQDSEGNWTIYQLEHAGGGISRCRERLSGSRYRITSVAGDQIIDLTDNKVVMRLVGQNRTLRLPLQPGAAPLSWQSTITADRRYEVDLKLKAEGCYGYRGYYYDLQAEVMLNGDIHAACARRGETDRRVIAGEYLMDTPQRLIRLVLNQQGQAVLQQDYLNEQPMLSERGRWQRMDNGRLLLLLESGPGRPPKPLLLEHHADSLQQRGFSPDFGQDGLRLYRSEAGASEKGA